MGKPSCYVFDMEGTLSDPSHRIHHAKAKEWKEWDEKFYRDPPLYQMVKLARNLAKVHPLFLFTGKHEGSIPEMQDWLYKHDVPIDGSRILARANGDWGTTTAEVKRGMVHKVRREGWFIEMAFDDMHEVIKVYQELNVPCLHIRSYASDDTR